MKAMSFLFLAIEQWQLFLALTVLAMIVTHLCVRRFTTAGIFDPLYIIFVGIYSVNYGVVLFLAVLGLIQLQYLAMVLVYGAALVAAFRISSHSRIRTSLHRYILAITPASRGPQALLIAVVIYGTLGVFIASTIGLGLFAETNRFDVAKGYGSYIRLMDSLAPFIISYWAANIFNRPRNRNRLLMIAGLALFVMLASVLNGAKASVILYMSTIALTGAVVRAQLVMSTLKMIVAGAVAVGFVLLAMSINLQENGVRQSDTSPLAGQNLVVERTVFRIIANGDVSYLTLPNGVIEQLDLDNFIVRFLAPIVGSGNLSRQLGYAVADYSIGRQALKYYAPGWDIAGGPTSHFDLFGYVYFGYAGGFIFALLIGYLLGTINRMVRLTQTTTTRQYNPYHIALVATLWSRSVLMILEPPMGFAYIVDSIIVFTALAFTTQLIWPRRASHAPMRNI